jgi:hypothetical protein
MTAKEKAKELVDKYSFVEIQHYTSMFEVKECALIAVQEIINANPHSNPFTTEIYSTMLFWQEVKQEIQQL